MRAESRVRDRYCAARWAKDLTMREDWLIIDTETTGLRNAEIVQIGVLSGAGEVILDSLVKPTISIPSQASIIHGITNDQVQKAPTFPEIYPHFVDVIANKALVIYNAKFDEAILKYCCDLANIKAINFTELHCAMYWYAKWIGDWSDYYGNYRWPRLPGADHTAIGDCRATLKIIQMMANSSVPESEETGEETSQRSSIIVPVQEADFSDHKCLIKDSTQSYSNHDKQTITTSHELDPLLVQTNREFRGDQSSFGFSNHCCQIRKESFIQGKDTVDFIPKKDLKKGNNNSTEELSSSQIDESSRCINSQQVQAYMRAREIGLKQIDAAYIAGFSERTGRRLEKGEQVGRLRQIGRPSPISMYEPLIYQWLTDSLATGAGQLKTSVVVARLQELGYKGGRTAVYDFVRQIRPPADISLVQDAEEVSIKWMHQLLQGRINESELLSQYRENLTSKEIVLLLDCISNRPIRYRNRAITLLSYLNNISRQIIADFLLISPETVADYIKNYQIGGVSRLLEVYKSKKIKKSQDPIYKNKVFEILHSPPSCYGINRTSWKMSDIYRIMAEEGVKISQDNIREIIKGAGYNVRSAKKVLTSTDPNYREKLQKITAILSSLGPKDKFFSIDEFGPFSVKIQGGKSLMPPGETRVVPQWQQSKGQVIMTAALELSTNQVTHFYSDKKDTEEMIKLLDFLMEKYAEEDCIYLSWDAASWHASQELYKKVDEINSPEYRKGRKLPIVKLAPLPASSQFLNIIESVFSGMARAIIHNSDYQSVEECKGAIDRYFSERNQYFIEHPKRAGKKIWGKERVEVEFKESNNCKDPRWR